MSEVITINKLKELEKNGGIDVLKVFDATLGGHIIGHYAIYSVEKLDLLACYSFNTHGDAFECIGEYKLSEQNMTIDEIIESIEIGGAYSK